MCNDSFMLVSAPVISASPSPAQLMCRNYPSLPLTDEDIAKAKSVYGGWAEDVAGCRLKKGYAVVDLYGSMMRDLVMDGRLCYKTRLTVNGYRSSENDSIERGAIQFEPFNHMSTVGFQYLVWLPPEGGLNCECVKEEDAFLLSHLIEKNTLIRLYRMAPSLLVEYAASESEFEAPNPDISPNLFNSG